MKYAGRERYIHRVAESTSLLRGKKKKQETHTHTHRLSVKREQAKQQKKMEGEREYVFDGTGVVQRAY